MGLGNFVLEEAPENAGSLWVRQIRIPTQLEQEAHPKARPDIFRG